MATDQVVQFSLATADLQAAKEHVLAHYPNALIGTKPLDDQTSLLWVTLYSVTPQAIGQLISALGQDVPTLQNRPTEGPSLSDLIAKVKQAQTGELNK